MKYSQAVLVACIGGAALASAIPTGETPASKPKGGRTHRIGKAVGKTAVLAGAFANKATGNTYDNSYTDYSSTTLLKKRTPTRGSRRVKAVQVAQKGKTFGKAVVEGAGGGTALAEGLGSVTNLLRQPESPVASSTLTLRRLTDNETPSENNPSSSSSEAATPAAPVAHVPNHHGHNGHHKAKETVADNMGAENKPKRTKKKKGSRRKSSNPSTPVSARSFEDELAERAFDDFEFLALSSRGPGDAETPAPTTPSSSSSEPVSPAAQVPHHHHGNHKKSEETVADNVGAENKPKRARKKKGSHRKSSNPSTPVSTRSFEDELEARLFDTLKANYYNRKAESLQKEAAKATAIAGVVGSSTVRRDLLDELDARDFDEELSMRDVDEELAARLFDTLKANYYNRKAQSLQQEAAKASAVAGVVGGTNNYRREFVDDLDIRDFEDDLEARNKFFNALGALKDTVFGKRPGAGSVATGAMAPTDPNAVVAREFFDELDARDFEDDLEARFRFRFGAVKDAVTGRRGGAASNVASTVATNALPPTDPNTVVGRDFADELDARDFEDELEARFKFHDVLGAVKDAVAGRRGGAASTVASTVATNSMPPIDPNGSRARLP